jgi:hypothetical protein
MHPSPLSRSVAARRKALRAAVAIGFAIVIDAAGVAAQTTSAPSRAARPMQQRARPLACDTGWSEPRMLRTRAGQPIYVESPVTVMTTDATYLIGSPTFVWRDSSAFVRQDSRRDIAAVGVKLLNDSTAGPAAAVAEHAEAVHADRRCSGCPADSGVGTSTDTSLAGVFAQDTLWEATLIAGRWSTARPIWASGPFVWHPSAASYVADDASLSIAFPATRTDRGIAS